MRTIAQIIDDVIESEGDEYTNDPVDRGGPTKYGITERVARAYGYLGAMQDLPRPIAYDIYLKQYVRDPKFSDIALVDTSLAAELVDTGVNQGPANAARYLQRALNYFQGDGLAVDGQIGPATMRSLQGMVKRRGTEGMDNLVKLVNVFQAMRYVDIVERDPTQRKYAYGWMDKRVVV
ncbi:MAG: lysozyme family protein [Caudoviricetes sp.]|nr:MAG: lysozyme family protein [Caudoviricetes sp.]